MTAINEAWAAPGSFLDLFLESFRHGEGTADLPRHLLIVAMDGKAFQRCLAVHPFCYWFRVAGMDFAGEQKYMKGDYLEMMWRRNRLQQRVLELGYSFLFTDVDILWFRSPFPRLPAGAQVVMSSDFFVGDPASPNNYPNGGLLYARSSPAGEIIERRRSSTTQSGRRYQRRNDGNQCNRVDVVLCMYRCALSLSGASSCRGDDVDQR